MSMSTRVPEATMNQAAALFADGASQGEVHRTTGISRDTLRKYFPGQRWTYTEGGQFRALTKKMGAI